MKLKDQVDWTCSENNESTGAKEVEKIKIVGTTGDRGQEKGDWITRVMVLEWNIGGRRQKIWRSDWCV